MKGYGSISIAHSEEEGGQPTLLVSSSSSSSNKLVDKNQEVTDEETIITSHSSRRSSTWKTWVVKNGPKFLAATLLVKVMAVSTGIAIFDSSAANVPNNHDNHEGRPTTKQQQQQLELWGSSHWKAFIRQDNNLSTPLYHTQIVDHNHPRQSGTFQQRYFENLHYWDGPGHPLFVILGGESPLENILYPFISEVLAKAYGGVTFNSEHRYFGESYPVKKNHLSNHVLRDQMTPRQAMQDFVHFIQAMQVKLGCSRSRESDDYCPVITIGGSYPGLLSVLLRINYPDTIDIGYGGGVPFHTWDNASPVESWAYKYYDYITRIAEQESPGCAAAVKETLFQTLEQAKQNQTQNQKEEAHHDTAAAAAAALAKEYGVCPNTVPENIKTAKSLTHKLIGKVAGRYSETNMEYYPPGPDRLFIKDCKVFQNRTATSPKERFRNFLVQVAKTDQNKDCYDLSSEGDDDDDDDDDSDNMWSILCCRLAPVMGRSKQSMFYPQTFNPQDSIDDCQNDFGITMDPSAVVRDYKFSHADLQQQSHILLTNGDSDGWSALSYQEDINESVVVMNFPNGAHHSELLHYWTPDNNRDTPDIRQGHEDIIRLIGQWLEEIKMETTTSSTTLA